VRRPAVADEPVVELRHDLRQLRQVNARIHDDESERGERVGDLRRLPWRGSTHKHEHRLDGRRNKATSLVHAYRADQWASFKATRSPTHGGSLMRASARAARNDAGSDAAKDLPTTTHMSATDLNFPGAAPQAECEKAKL
jgi:hypothetical protein